MSMGKKRTLALLLMAIISLFVTTAIAAGTLALPASMKEIKAEAFEGNTSLAEVVLPEGIETIGSRAFAGSSITSINLPSSIAYIADDAFEGCGGINVTAPEGTYAYGWAVNQGLIVLPTNFMYALVDDKVTITGYLGEESEIVIPETIAGYPVSCIGEGAFYDVTATSIVLPRFLESIEYGAFMASDITSIYIPASVKNISDDVFYMCPALQQIDVAHDNGVYVSVDGVLFEKNTSSLMQYPMAKSETTYSIPEGTANIENYAFYGNEYLRHVEIPEGVMHIGTGAFSWCIEIRNIELPDSLEYISAEAFYKCVSLESIAIPDAVDSIEDHVFYSCYALHDISFGDGIAKIGKYAFYDCEALTNLILPDGLKGIEYYAFGNCNYMEAVRIPASVELIEEKVFEDRSENLVIYGEEGSYTKYHIFELWQKANLTNGNTAEGARSAAELLAEEYYNHGVSSSNDERQKNAVNVFEVMMGGSASDGGSSGDDTGSEGGNSGTDTDECVLDVTPSQWTLGSYAASKSFNVTYDSSWGINRMANESNKLKDWLSFTFSDSADVLTLSATENGGEMRDFDVILTCSAHETNKTIHVVQNAKGVLNEKRQRVVERALAWYNYTWTTTQELKLWSGTASEDSSKKVPAGSKVRGIPYSSFSMNFGEYPQNGEKGVHIKYSVGEGAYKNYLDIPENSSDRYLTDVLKNGAGSDKFGPIHGAECTQLVSDVWYHGDESLGLRDIGTGEGDRWGSTENSLYAEKITDWSMIKAGDIFARSDHRMVIVDVNRKGTTDLEDDIYVIVEQCASGLGQKETPEKEGYYGEENVYMIGTRMKDYTVSELSTYTPYCYTKLDE